MRSFSMKVQSEMDSRQVEQWFPSIVFVCQRTDSNWKLSLTVDLSARGRCKTIESWIYNCHFLFRMHQSHSNPRKFEFHRCDWKRSFLWSDLFEIENTVELTSQNYFILNRFSKWCSRISEPKKIMENKCFSCWSFSLFPKISADQLIVLITNLVRFVLFSSLKTPLINES